MGEKILNAFFTRYVTPLTTGLFLVSAISGIALFFRWAPGSFHAMHEWLSMLLLVPFVLHMWRNWGAFMTYVTRKTLWIPLALCIVISIPFAWPSSQGQSGGGNPAFRVVRLMTQAPLASLAPMLKTSPDELVTRLQGLGYKTTSADDTLDKIAASSNEQSLNILLKLLPAHPQGGSTGGRPQ